MDPHKNSKPTTKEDDVVSLLERKKNFFTDVVQKTILHVNRNKLLDIINISDVNTCLHHLEVIHKKIKDFHEAKLETTYEAKVTQLQTINNELSSIIRSFGTESIDDLLIICFGNNHQLYYTTEEKEKYDLLSKYFHPINYKLTKPTNIEKKKTEKISAEDDWQNDNFHCTDISILTKSFHVKVFGMKIIIHNKHQNKCLVIQGIVDNVMVPFLENHFMRHKKEAIDQEKESIEIYKDSSFHCFLSSLSLKDWFILNSPQDVFLKFNGILSQNKQMQQKMFSTVIREFMHLDLYIKRTIIIQYLLFSDKYENKYMAYLLYDLLSNDTNGVIDTQEQTTLLDSFTWPIKQHFRDAMKKTIQYTHELTHFDINKIPLEQQICIMKTSDVVKEKAMLKLKEIKSKSEDSGTKARQYLEGLLKIPFEIYRKEPIFFLMDKIKKQFKELCHKHVLHPSFVPKQQVYTNIELMHYLEIIETSEKKNHLQKIKEILVHADKDTMMSLVDLHTFEQTKNGTASCSVVPKGKKRKSDIKKELLIQVQKYEEDTSTWDPFLFSSFLKPSLLWNEIKDIRHDLGIIQHFVQHVQPTLDKHVYGHHRAKRQVERILAQWINSDGEFFNEGHVLGLEGNPGIGKTTLAKGLAHCLLDEEGNPRPLAVIAMGGSSNSSTLVGHSYTYVGSTWGEIVQILMDKKCMNPIILIDEVDKISKTENGREIIGILTHLLDSTQNMAFQDKYFSGIEMDLSKVLFVLSYNDASLIDKILLDRIHRIKFDSLTMEEKMVISQKYLLPEMYKKTGLQEMIVFEEDALKSVIEDHTLESGVRKLKEKLFDIVSEINLEYLRLDSKSHAFPLVVTKKDIGNKYLKENKEIRIQKVHEEDRIGVINCLWANAFNVGGILSATACFIPTKNFLDLKLTGLIDKMMEESFQVSLSNAYWLLNDERKKWLQKIYNGKDEKGGIHMHMGDGSVEKSGTSAGIAITILFYSLFTQKKIRHNFAVTGEANDLNGKVGEIGALKTKILYGIKAGVKHFIYPTENQKDFDLFMEKNGANPELEGIQFYPVQNVKETLSLILVD